MSKIFISYRREDSADLAGRIYDWLIKPLGPFDRDSVFKDVDSIPLGVDFKKYLNDTVNQCDVELVVIGPRWIDIADNRGRRRLDDPADFVRIEIEAALRRDIPVIPLLVQGAAMPTVESLPPSLEMLAYRNGALLRRDPDFHHDMERIIKSVGLWLKQGSSQRTVPNRQVFPFRVPPLPYTYEALEPYIDESTMMIHHDKHHASYVYSMNQMLESHPRLQEKTVEELISNLSAIPSSIRTAFRNVACGHINHTMLWQLMAPQKDRYPTGDLAYAIDGTFGDFASFKDQFTKASMGRFGSGWAWLIAGRRGKLNIVSAPNQDNPMLEGEKPIFGIDLWEHAYYLKYQNRRIDYINAWWNVVNWDEVANRFAKLS